MKLDERSSQIQRDRRNILATLKMIYPGWMSGDELFETILDPNPDYTRTCMVKDMTYLHEKGYAEFRGLRGLYEARVSCRKCEFKLTAKGTELADRFIDDPALKV